MPETARLCRILIRNPDAALEAICLPNGTMLTGEQCLEYLLKMNFPSFRREHGKYFTYEASGSSKARGADREMATGIVEPERMKWAIFTFKLFTLAGPDWIFPALLQKGLELIVGPLTRTLRACLALGCTPSAWKLARVVFIPKTGRTSYFSAKDFRPINLTLFLLKTLENLVDAYVRDVILVKETIN